MNDEIKAVVLDDDSGRISRIMEVMPDYVDAIASKFEKDAQKLIAREDGTTIDLLIMYADDVRARSLYIFDWMKKDSDHLGLRRIPVVIYTEDAYSDRIMDFLEIDDVFIYEGEINDHDFFSLVSEAIESAASYVDEDYYDASYPDGKPDVDDLSYDDADAESDDEIIERLVKNNPERLMGLLLDAPGGDQLPRSMLIKDEDKLKSVVESIKASKEKSYQLRLILQQTVEDKKRREQLVKNYYRADMIENSSSPISQQSIDMQKAKRDDADGLTDLEYIYGQSGDYDELLDPDAVTSTIVHGHMVNLPGGRIGSVSQTQTELPGRQEKGKAASGQDTRIIDANRYNTQIPTDADTARSVKKIKKGFGPVSLANVFSQAAKSDSAPEPVKPVKKKVLIIDTDVRTRLSLNYYYSDTIELDYADSSMKAIDYFIQNKPDIVLIEYDMPYVNGIMILDSIRRQPNGTGVKAIILLDVTKHNDLVATISTRPGVDGLIYKPFMKEQFIGVMQRFIS